MQRPGASSKRGIMSENLYQILSSRFPADRDALFIEVPGGRRDSYGDLENTVGRFAHALRQAGLKAGDRVVEFATGAIADALARATLGLEADGEISESRDWPGAIVDWASRHRLRAVVTAYAPVGPVAELLAKVGRELARHDIRLIELRREYDNTTWPHAQRGYFKLKKQIPKILERLAIPAAHDGARRVALQSCRL